MEYCECFTRVVRKGHLIYSQYVNPGSLPSRHGTVTVIRSRDIKGTNNPSSNWLKATVPQL